MLPIIWTSSKRYYHSRQLLWKLSSQPRRLLSPFVSCRFFSSSSSSSSSVFTPPSCQLLHTRSSSSGNAVLLSASRASSSSSSCKRTLISFSRYFKRKLSSDSFTSDSPPHLRGLFSIPELQTPSDFAKQAALAIQQCDALRASLEQKASSSSLSSEISSSSDEAARHVLYQLDEISRIVCNVIDAAELCRNVHVKEAWRDAASRAFATLSDYIAQLNADPCLYQALRLVLNGAAATATAAAANGGSSSSSSSSDGSRVVGGSAGFLTAEEYRLAQQLLLEFERDGIHLPHHERQEVRLLQNQIVELETMFSRNLVTWHRNFGASASDVQAVLPPHVLAAFGITCTTTTSSDSNSDLTLTSDAQLLQTLLKYSSSPSLRKQVYMEYNTAVPENTVILEALRQRRHELARKCSNSISGGGGSRDWESYAERLASNQMAQTPANVQAFLQKTAQNLQPALQQELQLLSQAKQTCEGNSTLEAWDVTHYTGLLKSRRGSAQFDPSEIAQYLSLTQCLASMKQLCLLLFGIDMQEESMANQERWDGIETTTLYADGDDGDATLSQERVRRFVLTDTNHGRRRPLGTLYLDLHPRPGKYGHAAHFTVRCGCRVRPPVNHNVDDNSDTDDSYDSDDYQLPVVALVCNLSSAGVDNKNATLTHGEVETLFHEFGHALHSLLSRTSFQHMSGTRGAMDFVEMPSHLMEHYVWDINFLKHHLTVHPTTRQAMPDDLIQKLQQSRHDFHAIERQTQILYATLDQKLFGVPNPDVSMNHSTAIFAQLHKEFNLPYAAGTHWHSRFGHLVTYGAVYYSYLYAQVLASDVWKHLFRTDSLDKEAGMELWHKVLIHGGGKDPTRLLRGLLGRPPPSFGRY